MIETQTAEASEEGDLTVCAKLVLLVTGSVVEVTET